ncbi:putative receptor-like protein kinase [Dorcoceras hygrometricum]|uniref:non-specific serine/threonine protein kinase n=1 Tax=Dorcoceras hygrometricum TaxID=472368 RepID=A0A2Z7A8P0_9LAMI|nr:putative receptor-like protein kinase [Dorcoceras hygrometricum]
MQYYLLILSCLIITKASCAEQNSSCNPSSCGDIRNISYPFRLKDDPQHCGDPNYEISCENNTAASIYVDSHKYHVRSINYHNYTIRLADPTIKNNDTCSFPSYFPNWNNLSWVDNFPYSIYSQRLILTAWPVTVLSCPILVNDSLVIQADKCVTLSSDASITRHMYIKVGNLYAQDVWDLCRIDLVALTSWPLSHDDQETELSLSEIHDSLLYGFELSWYNVYCSKKCNIYEYCTTGADGTAACVRYQCGRTFQMLTFDIGPVPLYYVAIAAMLLVSEISAGYILVTRVFIGLPFLIGILTYKFRTRHLSVFGKIEAFLQSQNMNLMPIRYSYSDIKKMTKGFREKLGKGGYGSVYKGRLRSGTIVAVKLLSDPSANGQDFINEVATIGRIHHVNVVELVGYCAEKSKFALVYDFMPNGSLEKYIFDRESGHGSLSWDTKYAIAVGVARGIEYLHRGCDIQILHFDIKPHNILLTENFTPKISDFGLAKFCSTDKNIVTLTAARGTIGYVAPELINRSIGGSHTRQIQYFPDWIYDRFNDGKDVGIGDADECSGKKIKRMTIVALWCIQMSPDDRPSMSKVLEMLESDTELLQIPPQPSELPQVAETEDQTWETYSDSVSFLVHDTSRSV